MNYAGNEVFMTAAITACLVAGGAGIAIAQDDVAKPAAEVADAAKDDYKAKATELINAGLDWLKANQSESGAWSDENYPGLSALGLWAMARSGREDLADSRAKAAAYISRYVQSDGSIYKPASGGRGTGGLSTYNTAICMTALHAHDKVAFQKEILKAREFVASSQLEGDSAPGAGGFGYEKPVVGGRPGRADLSNTGLALMAMRLTQDVEDLRPADSKNADVDWKAALAFVESMQIKAPGTPDDGAFGYEASGERGGQRPGSANAAGAQGMRPASPDTTREAAQRGERRGSPQNGGQGRPRESLRTFGSMTYAGLESMIYAQVDLADPRVRSTIEWAGRNWTVAENPGQGIKGLYYYYVILSKALVLAGDVDLVAENGAKIDWRKDIVEQLEKSKDADGFWANEDNTFWEGDPALVTAYAVLALESAMGL